MSVREIFDRAISQRGASSSPAICFFFSPALHLTRFSGIALSPHRSNKSARIFATRRDVGDLYEGSASAPSGAPAIVVF
jgi:hypothetical protein